MKTAIKCIIEKLGFNNGAKTFWYKKHVKEHIYNITNRRNKYYTLSKMGCQEITVKYAGLGISYLLKFHIKKGGKFYLQREGQL